MTNKINLSELLADREAGTGGEWAVGRFFNGREVVSGHACVAFARKDFKKTEVAQVNARRIARLPALEAAYIEAVGLLDELYGAAEDCICTDDGRLTDDAWARYHKARMNVGQFLGDGE